MKTEIRTIQKASLLGLIILLNALTVFGQVNVDFKQFSLAGQKTVRSGMDISPDGKYLAIAGILFCGNAYAGEGCNAILQSNAFNTTDFSSSAKLLLKRKDDVCDKDYSSEAEAKSAARSAGGSIGYGGFSLSGSAAHRC